MSGSRWRTGRRKNASRMLSITRRVRPSGCELVSAFRRRRRRVAAAVSARLPRSRVRDSPPQVELTPTGRRRRRWPGAIGRRRAPAGDRRLAAGGRVSAARRGHVAPCAGRRVPSPTSADTRRRCRGRRRRDTSIDDVGPPPRRSTSRGSGPATGAGPMQRARPRPPGPPSLGRDDRRPAPTPTPRLGERRRARRRRSPGRSARPGGAARRPVQPLEPDSLHPRRRPPGDAGEEVEAPPMPMNTGAPTARAVAGDPALLLRVAERDARRCRRRASRQRVERRPGRPSPRPRRPTAPSTADDVGARARAAQESAASLGDAGGATEQHDRRPSRGGPLDERRHEVDAGRALADRRAEQPRRPDDRHAVGDRQVGAAAGSAAASGSPAALTTKSTLTVATWCTRPGRPADADHLGDAVDGLVERDVVDGHAEQDDARGATVAAGHVTRAAAVLGPDPLDRRVRRRAPATHSRTFHQDHRRGVEQRAVHRPRARGRARGRRRRGRRARAGEHARPTVDPAAPRRTATADLGDAPRRRPRPRARTAAARGGRARRRRRRAAVAAARSLARRRSSRGT